MQMHFIFTNWLLNQVVYRTQIFNKIQEFKNKAEYKFQPKDLNKERK